MNFSTGTLVAAKTEFRWKIERFSSKTNWAPGGSIYSPQFDVLLPGNHCVRWRLKMYPAGLTAASKDYVGLFVVLCSDTTATINYSISALNEGSGEVFKEKSTYKKEFNTVQSNSWGYECFFSKNCVWKDGNNLLVDDTLTIFFNMIIPDLVEDEGENDEDINSVSGYYEELLKNGNFSDVTVTIGRKKIPLHKIVLSSVSPVFQAMFAHDMKENNENTVKITDIKYKIAMEMFRYMYCKKVNDIDAIAEELLKAADKYSITGLRKLCETSILKSLNIDNVLKYLLLVTTYETPRLKSKVMEFVIEHLNEIVDKPEYNELDVDCKDVIIRALADERKKQVKV